MRNLGIRGSAEKLMRNYLTNRKQRVRIDGVNFSTKELVKTGVTQGSNLGSTLFMIYTNDLREREVEDKSFIKFADDTAASSTNSHLTVTIDKLQRSVDKIQN